MNATVSRPHYEQLRAANTLADAAERYRRAIARRDEAAANAARETLDAALRVLSPN